MNKTSIPGTTFAACPAYEKLRIAYHAAILASGFYRRREYLISPKIIPQYAGRCVVIPEFVAQLSSTFWVDAIEAAKTMPIQLTEAMQAEVSSYEVESVVPLNVERFEQAWRKVEQEYWQTLHSLLPEKVRWIGSIEVRITKYATQVSYYLLEKKDHQHLIIHVREDASLMQLARIIIVALLWPDRESMGLTWSKRMAVADYLMSLAPLQKLFGKLKSSLVRKPIAPAWLTRSEQYIASLHVPQVLQPLDVIRQHITLFGEKERKILLRIVEAKGEIVSQDEVADLQWGTGEFGSFWAMNKIVQRIRHKLRSIGLDSSKLQSIRGQGYLWQG